MKKRWRHALPLTAFLFGTLASGSLAAAVIDQGHSIDEFPTEFSAFIPCLNGGAGEEVYVSGSLRISMHWLVRDEWMMWNSTLLPVDMMAVGLTTGRLYRATGRTGEMAFQRWAVYPWVSTYETMLAFIGDEPGDNFYLKEKLIARANANGELVVNRYESEFTCNPKAREE